MSKQWEAKPNVCFKGKKNSLASTILTSAWKTTKTTTFRPVFSPHISSYGKISKFHKQRVLVDFPDRFHELEIAISHKHILITANQGFYSFPFSPKVYVLNHTVSFHQCLYLASDIEKNKKYSPKHISDCGGKKSLKL